MQPSSRSLAVSGGVQGPAHRAGQRHALGGLRKRGFDILIAVSALVLLAPLFIMVAGLIKMTCPGPVIFWQERIGFGGRRFRCFKFRTMAVDSARLLADLLARSPEAQLEWDANRKLKADPRVTRIGQILRRTSVDELPQLFNVLKGDMSVVGPRPIVEDELGRYGLSAKAYMATRPGLTGLWQISGRNDVSYSSRVCLDRTYVRTWSLGKDIVIVALTVPAVLSARGTY